MYLHRLSHGSGGTAASFLDTYLYSTAVRVLGAISRAARIAEGEDHDHIIRDLLRLALPNFVGLALCQLSVTLAHQYQCTYGLHGKLCAITARKNRRNLGVGAAKKQGFNATGKSKLTIIVGHITDHAPILALRRPQVIQAAGWCRPSAWPRRNRTAAAAAAAAPALSPKSCTGSKRGR